MRGFTIVELVIVIIVLAILAATALPRFMESADEARLSAAQHATGGFETGVSLLHGEWLVNNRPSSLVIDGVTVNFDANGWPTSVAPGVNACLEIWDAVYHSGEPVVQYVALATPEAWSALRFGSICLYVYQYGRPFAVGNPLPFFIYQPLPTEFRILRFNMV